MAGFCVILSGRLPGDGDDASIWAPLRAAFNLDDAEFAQRVLASVPLIVRQNLDEQAATDLVQQMVSGGIDAVALQEDLQLAYFEREGARRGPLPRTGLRHFVRIGERYRLVGEQEWSTWGRPLAPGQPQVARPAFRAPAVRTVALPATPSVLASTTPLDGPVVGPAPTAPLTLGLAPSEEAAPAVGAVESLPSPVSMPAEFASTVENAYEEDFDTVFPEEPDETADLEAPANHTPAFARDQQKTPGRSRAGLWSVLAIFVCASALYAWSSLDHPSATGTLPSSPAALSDHVSALAGDSSSTPASSARILPSTSATSAAELTATPVQARTGSSTLAATSGAIAATDDAVPTPRSSLPRHCEARAVNPQATEEVTLLSDGKNHLTGRNVRAGARGELFIVEAALAYDTECRPSPFQIYVFSRGKLAGTLAPQPMLARTDGAILGFKLLDPEHLQVEIAHYKPGDSPCCSSSQEQRIIDLKPFLQDPESITPPATTTSPLETAPASTGVMPATTSFSTSCVKATGATENAICTDTALGSLDNKVTAMYRQATAQATADNIATLKDDQTQWLQYRSRCNADKDCIERQSKARISLLQTQFKLK